MINKDCKFIGICVYKLNNKYNLRKMEQELHANKMLKRSRKDPEKKGNHVHEWCQMQ